MLLVIYIPFTDGSTYSGLSFNVGCNGVKSSTLAFSSVSPNPVSDVLNISFDNEAITQQKISKTFNIRLYDNFGALMKQTMSKGEDIKLNVSDLSNGYYYIYIYPEGITTPEIHKIIVKK